MDTKTQNIFNVINNNENLVNSIIESYSSALAETGDSSYTRFMNAVKQVANTHLKPNVSTSRASSGGTINWKNDIKQEFTGRGRQWFYVSLDDINPVLDKFDADGFDTTAYRADIGNLGKAWVRFASVTGTELSPQIKVEVRINGSKIDHPANRVNMPYTNNIERLEDGKTPFSLGLESSDSKVIKASSETEVSDVADSLATDNASNVLIDNEDESLKAFVSDVKTELENEVFDIDDDDDELMSLDEMAEIFG
jgi:hypothetical protein